MTFLTDPALMAGGAVALTLLGGLGGAFVATRLAMRREATAARDLVAMEARLMKALAEIEARQIARIAALAQSVDMMKSDVELLAGEWSIRQAIEMAAEGLDPLGIEQASGLSPDEVQTLLRVRPH